MLSKFIRISSLTHDERVRVSVSLGLENGQNHAEEDGEHCESHNEHDTAFPNVTFPLSRLDH
jgi:hypothetical protein